MTTADKRATLEAALKEYVGTAIGPAARGSDVVNESMIRHWCQAMGDENPAYLDAAAAARTVHGGIVAPPTMMQAWILEGLPMAEPASLPQDGQRKLHALFDSYGYTGVVATDCEQEYTRYLRPGDAVSALTTIESISEQKATALGVGYFIVTRSVFSDSAGSEVGWMTFRVLKFQPVAAPAAVADPVAVPAAPQRIRPARAHDNAWWWEAIDAGHLLIQRCADCGVLRHPPRPMCGRCQSIRWDSVASRGLGTIHSYVIMHHPPIPGYDFPLAVAVIELEEGTRIVSNIVDCDHDAIEIGMTVECRIEVIDDELKLPQFFPVESP